MPVLLTSLKRHARMAFGLASKPALSACQTVVTTGMPSRHSITDSRKSHAGVIHASYLEKQSATLCETVGLVLPEINSDLAIQSILLRAGLPQVRAPNLPLDAHACCLFKSTAFYLHERPGRSLVIRQHSGCGTPAVLPFSLLSFP